MKSGEHHTSPRYSHLTPEQAADLLRKRLMTIGGVTGGLMGIGWGLLSSVVFSAFPPFGTGPFYVLLFLAAILLGGSGLLLGRYFYTKITRGNT